AVSIVEINIPPGLPHVYSLEGRYLQREGTQTNPLPARKLRQLLVERGLVQFEAQVPPGASLEDLNMDRVSAYAEAIGFPVQSEQDLIELLVRRGCLKRTGKRIYPTYAAILLFGRYPQQWLPSATILAARFSGQTFADQFVKEEIGGTLPEQLRRAEAF